MLQRRIRRAHEAFAALRWEVVRSPSAANAPARFRLAPDGPLWVPTDSRCGCPGPKLTPAVARRPCGRCSGRGASRRKACSATLPYHEGTRVLWVWALDPQRLACPRSGGGGHGLVPQHDGGPLRGGRGLGALLPPTSRVGALDASSGRKPMDVVPARQRGVAPLARACRATPSVAQWRNRHRRRIAQEHAAAVRTGSRHPVAGVGPPGRRRFGASGSGRRGPTRPQIDPHGGRSAGSSWLGAPLHARLTWCCGRHRASLFTPRCTLWHPRRSSRPRTRAGEISTWTAAHIRLAPIVLGGFGWGDIVLACRESDMPTMAHKHSHRSGDGIRRPSQVT